MSHWISAAIAIVLCAVGGRASAIGAGVGVVGSPHDFTNDSTENNDANPTAWNNKRKEICRVCHVPHDHADVRYGNQGILWNHQISTKTGWQMYGSDSSMIQFIDGSIEAAPVGTSKLCLGCHDGVSAVNQYDGKTPADAGYGGGTAFTMDDIGPFFVVANTTASLTNNHPISITYDTTADPRLLDPGSAVMRNGDSVTSLLDTGRVECSTCHDVHDREAVPGTHLLREATAGADVSGAGASDLCLVCHDK